MSALDSIEQPEDPECVVWRYMDLLELFAMLESRAIHFTRVDMLVDPLEGTYPQSNRRLADAMRSGDAQMLQRFSDIETKYRRSVAISSWYESERESALMWKLYAGDHGVAIMSRFGRLYEAFTSSTRTDNGDSPTLPGSVMVSRVRYFGSEQEDVPGDDPLWPFLHKWHHYSDEREVRALYLDEQAAASGDELPDDGVVLPVDLDTLIEHVVISPFMPEWAHGPISAMLERTAVADCIAPSSLPAGVKTV